MAYNETHIAYSLRAERKIDGCWEIIDDFHLHTKGDLDAVTVFLRGMGFKVRIKRSSVVTLVDELLPDDDNGDDRDDDVKEKEA